MKKILEIKNLEIEFSKRNSKIQALRNVNFDLFENEIISLVGESGSGKSVAALSILKLLDSNANITNGKILFENENILQKSEKEMQKIRGNKISIIFQDPLSSLNPTMKIGHQILEAIKQNRSKQKVLSLLRDVQISDPEIRFNQYPHEISGGMRQRVMIAIAIASKPKILIADEPTTALDRTVQSQILDLLRMINQKYKTSIILISHDLSVVSDISSKIFVMYGGKVIEFGKKNQILKNAKHPYTQMLLKASNNLYDQEEIAQVTLPLHSIFHKKGICKYFDRCLEKQKECSLRTPSFYTIDTSHKVFCFLYKNSEKKLEEWKKKKSSTAKI